ncbi:MAG TPA: ABC transporter ATP-binding protein [Xanthomonadales bacterium]|nr:ABC transporter ATP-binding protein [Xanthomonadales bacterium]
MLKTLRYGLKVFQIFFKSNGLWAIADTLNRLYGDTFYPLIQVYLLSKLLDLLATGKQITFSDITWMIAFYLAAGILKLLLYFISVIRGAGYEFSFGDYIELQIDKKLHELDPAVFESTKFQNLLAQMNGVKGSMFSYCDRTLRLVGSFAQLVTAIIVVSTKFPIFVPIIILSIIPLFLSLNKHRDDIWIYMSQERGQLERLLQYVRTTFSAPATSKEVAIFKNGPALMEKFKRSKNSYYRRFEKAYSKTLFILLISGVIQMTAFVITQAINLAAVFAGKLGIGQFTLYFQQTRNLASGAEGVLDNYSSMNMRTKYVDQYFELLNYSASIQSPKKPKTIPAKPQPPTLEFRNVSFRYPESDRYILKNLSIIINSGEKLALVGENGAGKSTIIKLILRFYDPTDGEILINGVNIKDINLDLWYKQIGALFQDFIKYQFTFKENVIFGDLSKKDDLEVLKKALNKSGADNILEQLPKGDEQIVGKTFEDGVDLSGGQWQKLALARAFFRDAPILILDEPTSAIDAKAEYEIFERVQKLQRDKTVIIISHRFSTVRNADRIIVLDEGIIVEEGNHTKLMKKNGLYAELFNIQAKGYK